MKKTTVVKLIEQREGVEIQDLLPRLFEEEGSVRRVAERLGVCHPTVTHWMKRHNLKVTRTITGG